MAGKKGWTPESIRKMKETRARNKALRESGAIETLPNEQRIKEALVFLNYANRSAKADHRSGMLPSYALYIQLAIRTLRGEA